MSRMNINVGDFVTVNTRSKPEYNCCLWKVVAFLDNDRVVLITVSDDSNSMVHSISVKQDAITTTALVPAHETSAHVTSAHVTSDLVPAHVTSASDDVMTLQRFVLSSSRLNTWVHLPGLGGNAIFLRLASANSPPLVMYNELRGYELWFHSDWSGDTIQLVDCDILKLCPQRQVWPWCSWCQRFLLPVDEHRCSKRHAKLSFLMRDFSQSLDDIQRQVIGRLTATSNTNVSCLVSRTSLNTIM